MSNLEEVNKDKKNVSVYQQLSGILNALKSEQISINDAMNKIQLKNSRPIRPYCKVTSSGALALYGITKQPIVLYLEQWNKLLHLVNNKYIENYIKYNSDRLKTRRKKIFTNNKISQDIEEENVDFDSKEILDEDIDVNI